ncbi:hypothetical protein [Streptomyces sp. NRRL S-1813]|nr:hypothetical protein [Streptomyces sp. NRRL S-1813]
MLSKLVNKATWWKRERNRGVDEGQRVLTSSGCARVAELKGHEVIAGSYQ